MKTTITLMLCTLMLGCGGAISDKAIDSGITIGVSTGLRMGIKDDAKRAMVANYIDVGAHALRTVVGNPSPAELADLMNAWIPADIKKEYPEVVAFLIPTVITVYQAAVVNYGKHSQKARDVLDRIATDLENGAAPYITPDGRGRI